MSSSLVNFNTPLVDPKYSIIVSNIPKSTKKVNIYVLFEPFGTISDIIPYDKDVYNDKERNIIEGIEIIEDVITCEKCFIIFNKDTIDSVKNISLHLDKLNFSNELENIQVEPLIISNNDLIAVEQHLELKQEIQIEKDERLSYSSSSPERLSHSSSSSERLSHSSTSTSNHDEDGIDSHRESFDEEYKLFVGMLPKDLIEDNVSQLFKPFGKLKEVYVIRKERMYSKGCAFVKYYSKTSADKAIEILNGTVLSGSLKPLVVRYANKSTETPHVEGLGQHEEGVAYVQQQLQQQFNMKNRSRNSPRAFNNTQSMNGLDNNQHKIQPRMYHMPIQGNDIKYMSDPQIPSTFGSHYRNAYGNYSTAPTHNNNFSYGNVPDMQQYMIPDWYNMQPPNMGYAVSTTSDLNSNYANMNMHSMPSGSPPIPPIMLPISPNAHYGMMTDNNMNRNINYQEKSFPIERNTGPEGANLFIYHIPRDISDQDLRTLFSKYGKILSAKVYVDKNTLESKGFGFISYDNAESAQLAISNMHGYPVGSKKLKVELKKSVK